MFICFLHSLILMFNLNNLLLLSSTTNHKIIGILYGYIGYIGGFFGFYMSIKIRMQVNNQSLAILRLLKEVILYNNWITIHGILMLFIFIMPVAIGYYGNYILPMLIGTSELSMPRINGIAYYLLIISILIFLIANLLFSKPISSGWTFYPPLSSNDADNIEISIDYSLLSIHVLGLSSSISSINFMTTNKSNRPQEVRKRIKYHFY